MYKLNVYVKPNSKKSKIIGYIEGRLHISISAPAQEGKANKELIKFLSKQLDIPKSKITLFRGEKNKNKVLVIDSDREILK